MGKAKAIKVINPLQDNAQDNAIVNFNPEALISKAIENNLPVETMERLLAMRKELKAEWAKEQFDKAMANFQSECPTITKTKEVHTKSGAMAYKYAPIESIIQQVKNPLQANGFSYSTKQEMLEGSVKISVKVTHSAGHSEVTEMTVPLGDQTAIMNKSQVVAAASTFAKRYAFLNALGIMTGDEDTDGIIPPEDPAPPEIKPEKQPDNKPTDKQIELITSLCKQKRYTKEDIMDLGFTKLTGGKDGTASELIDYLLKAQSKININGKEIIDLESPEVNVT